MELKNGICYRDVKKGDRVYLNGSPGHWCKECSSEPATHIAVTDASPYAYAGEWATSGYHCWVKPIKEN